MKHLFMLGLLFAAPQFAAAESQFGLSLYKTESKSDGDNISGESKDSFYDLKINTDIGPVYVGGIYGTRADDNTGSEYGVTLGVRSKSGFFGELHYFLAAEYKSSSNEFKKGSGLGVDLGYNAMLGSSFYMGFQFAYRTITYKEFNTATAENKITSLKPMINLGFMF